MGCALLGVGPGALAQDRGLYGQLLETFVYQKLKRQSVCQEQPLSFFHYRDKDQVEVDVDIERGTSAVAGVEVKASATVSTSDFRGLHKLKKTTGNRFASGVVLYDGEIASSFGDGMYAVPIRQVCEGRVFESGFFVLGKGTVGSLGHWSLWSAVTTFTETDVGQAALSRHRSHSLSLGGLG